MDQQLMHTGTARVLELKLQQVRAAAAAARLEAEAAQLELLLLEQLGVREGAAAEQPAAVVFRPPEKCQQPLVDEFSLPTDYGEPAAEQVDAPADEGLEPDLQAAAEALILAVRELAAGRMDDSSQKNLGTQDAASESDFKPPQDTGSRTGKHPSPTRKRGTRPEKAFDFGPSLADSGPSLTPRAGMVGARLAADSPDQGRDNGMNSVPRLGRESEDNGANSVPRRSPEGGGSATPRRWKPASWLVSSVAHGVVLGLLSLVSLASPQVRDQLAFTASAASATEELDHFTTIEALTPQLDESDPNDWEPLSDSQPVRLADWETPSQSSLSERMAESLAASRAESPAQQASHLLASAVSRSALGQPLRTLAPSGTKHSGNPVQFAGIAGGGNHFVYLVDSSHSMLKFAEARAELLRSIEALKPDQRFYVVFYDEQPKYMRISHPGRQEPESVYATPANKLALRNWAMTVTQQRGLSPPDVLRFAFGLQPDVIFLLSDGEFSARTETVIRDENHRSNLFGESSQRSIIHTIRFPGVSSTEGRKAEQQMQRIAQENGGQYRNVEF